MPFFSPQAVDMFGKDVVGRTHLLQSHNVWATISNPCRNAVSIRSAYPVDIDTCNGERSTTSHSMIETQIDVAGRNCG
jgi:hypothetical protein